MFKIDYKKFIVLFISAFIFIGTQTVSTIEDTLVLASDNVAPTIKIIKPPKEGVTVSDDSVLKIIWDDFDPDSNAKITLYWDKDSDISNNSKEEKNKTWGVIADNIVEDPETCADEHEIYNLKVIGVPTWCPWSRYFYVLAEISDCSHYPIPYDYSGKVTVVTKASIGGAAVSLKGARIIVGPNAFSNDVYLSIVDNPNETAIFSANFKLSGNSKISSRGELDKTVHKFKAIDIYGNIYGSADSTSNSTASIKVTDKGSLVITIPYTSKIASNLKYGEDNLRILYLNEGRECWQLIERKHIVNKAKKEVSVQVNRLGIYRLAEVLGNTQDTWHSPNPLRYKIGEKEGVFFKDIGANYSIKIYDLSGEEIKNIANGNNYYWNITKDNVASGVYFYLIFDANGNLKHKDKIAIIK